MADPQRSDLDFGNVARITNLPDPSSAQNAATKAYVDAADTTLAGAASDAASDAAAVASDLSDHLGGITQHAAADVTVDDAGGKFAASDVEAVLQELAATVEGLNWKDSVRVASTANVSLATAPSSIDGITLASGDRILLKNQTQPENNGIYAFVSAGTGINRTRDMNLAVEVEGAIVYVEEGTANAATTWRQSAVNITLGSDSLSWTAFGTAASSASETTAGIAEIATQAETDTGTDDTRFLTPLKGKTASWTPDVVLLYTVNGTLTTGVGHIRLPIHRTYTIIDVRTMVDTAPTGSGVTVDVNKNGTTIFTTQGGRPAIAASGTSAVSSTPDVTALAAGDYLTVDIDVIGSTTSGVNLTVSVRLRQS